MTQNNILVTGGAGYIGSHVCKALAQAGYTPITYDNLKGGYRWAVKWGPFIQNDILNTEALCSVFEQYSPLAVFHLASSINVRESLQDPGKYYHNNVCGTLSLLQAMVRCRISYLVFSSTASIFGNPHYVPMDENHPKAPLHAYGKSKYMVELMLEDFQKAHGLCSAALRYFNAAGADKEGEIGEAHVPETHLIPLVIQTALGQREALDIYGANYNTEDGTAVRDYIHVYDLALAHIKALEWLIANKKSLQVNLGTGQGYSIKQVIESVQQISGKKVMSRISAPSPDAACLVANPSKAFEILHWKPQHSSLEQIVESALGWHTKS